MKGRQISAITVEPKNLGWEAISWPIPNPLIFDADSFSRLSNIRRCVMRYTYPEPEQVGVDIPRHLIRQRFCDGFFHALKGGQITQAEQLRLSFREGYRAGKFYLRDLRRSQNVVTFPVQGRMAMRSAYPS